MYKNKSDALAYAIRYKKENNEKLKKANAKWYQENKPKARLTKKAYYKRNSKRILARRKEWYKKNPDKLAKYRLKQNFGMTLEEYQKLKDAQGGVCCICKLKVNVLVVDHCHQKGNVRGLLCHLCNSGLGYFKDKVANLESAIKYLKKQG